MIKYPNVNFIIKNTEHHLERHYEIETNKTYYLQYVYVSDEFYDDRFNHCLGMSEPVDVKNMLLDEYGSHTAAEDFWFLKERTFTSFFRESNVDVPRCFRKTLSVRRSINEIKLLKFNNYLMRHGKRLSVFTSLVDVLHQKFHDPYHLDERTLKLNYSWKSVFLLLNFALKHDQNTKLLPHLTEEPTSYNHLFTPTAKAILPEWDFNKWLFKNVYDILPMFSFYIYRVDKKIFKNTRGKSGKFTFIWKYVTPYKRMFLVMHWLMKELRIKPGRHLKERLTSLIHSITVSPKSTWIYRVKKFSHNYVYRNSRQTLAENYRTVTK